MKARFFAVFLVFFAFLLFSPFPLLAAEDVGICADNPDDAACQLATFSISDILGSVVSFIFVIAVILALGFLVYGGIRWITSGGDKEGVAHARGTIIAAIIGLVLIILSYFILNFVLTFLTGQGLSGVTIPSLTRNCEVTRNEDGTVATCTSPNVAGRDYICVGEGGETGHWDRCVVQIQE